ncbi:DUF2505 domain-containing protein [Modestobacter lapidis]|nr:DUF2505 domain-containing protein [Modestobacter lapidis]
MPFDHSATYPAGPDEVLAVLLDETFLRERADALGTRVQDVQSVPVDGGHRTTVRLTTPTAGIPPVFARFVGAEVAVVDRQTWSTDGGTGHRAVVEVHARVFGRLAGVTGERRLVPSGGGTRSTVTGEATVDAPLIGRQAEAAVRELAMVVARRDHDLLRRWLGR